MSLSSMLLYHPYSAWGFSTITIRHSSSLSHLCKLDSQASSSTFKNGTSQCASSWERNFIRGVCGLRKLSVSGLSHLGQTQAGNLTNRFPR